MKNYPLMDNERDHLKAASGRSINDVTLDADDLTADDLSIHAETLMAQADIAENAGNPSLAANLRRAAELTRVPNEELLKMYEILRPGRASHEQLMLLATRLENHYDAPQNAAFVREAAEAYQSRGLLRREG